MSHEKFKLQIDTLKDKANFVLHGAACGATCVAIGYYVNSPVITGVSLGASLLINYPLVDVIYHKMTESFPATPVEKLPVGTKHLPDVIENLSQRLGIHSPPPLYAFDEKPQGYDFFPRRNDDNDLKSILEKVFGKFANAAAYGTSTYGVLISRPLLYVLNPKEEETVVAHELGHISAKHMQKFRVLNTFNITTAIIAGLNYLATILGSWAGIFSLVSSIVVSSVVGTAYANKHSLDLEDLKDKAKLKKVTDIVGMGVLLGAAYVQGRPEIIVAWAAAKAVTKTTEIINAHYMRCAEFQADRISAEVTRDPRSLVSSLHKINEYNIDVEPELEKMDYKRGPLILRPYKRAKAFLFWNHPHTDNRCHRLEKMAQRFQKSAPAPT